MAAILFHISEQAVFEPAAITAMSRALEETCTALHVLAGDERGREAIAKRIIDLARHGVIDAEALRDHVVQDAKSAA